VRAVIDEIKARDNRDISASINRIESVFDEERERERERESHEEKLIPKRYGSRIAEEDLIGKIIRHSCGENRAR